MPVPADRAVANVALYNLRDARGWSQQDVADRINELAARRGHHTAVTFTAVSRWERGIIGRPDPLYRQLLAEALGVSVEELGYTRQRARGRDLHVSATEAEGGADRQSGGTVIGDVGTAVSRDVEADQQRWCEVRGGMNATRVQLSKLAAQLYEPSLRFGETGLLARPDWILPEPVDFAAVDLDWLDGTVPPPELTGAEDSTRAVRPLASAGRRYQRYTHAIRGLSRPSLFENRLSYRLTDLAWKPGGGRMVFGTTTYFDMVDVCEAAAHEFAAAHLSFNGDGPVPADRASWRRLPFRKQVDDPFDLARRPLLPSVNTLTIRRTESSASFVLHRRDPAKVAVAGGMLHIMPAGVFQPAGISSQAQRHDFDLWRNVMREYSEEFLGDPEHDGSSGSLVDYDHEEPFRSLDQARRDGRVRAWLLGMGLDALVLAGEILSVVVFDADVYDEIFGDAVAVNTEGNVVSSGMAGATGIGFNEENIRHIVDHEPIAPSAAACLELAWQHRGRILAR